MKHEQAIASLYSAFAAQLPKMAKFWSGLAVEEHAHADVLRSLGKKIAASEVAFERDATRLAKIMEAVETMELLARDVKTQGISERHALHLAEQIELSMLEWGVFKMFRSYTEEMVPEFQALESHTARHLQLLKDESKKRKHWWSR